MAAKIERLRASMSQKIALRSYSIDSSEAICKQGDKTLVSWTL